MRPATPAMKKTFAKECTRLDLVAVLEATEAAYSADRYNSWKEVAKTLLKSGCSRDQTIAIMCSKWTRWAADRSGQAYGKVSARFVLDFVAKQGMAEVEKLTNEHFNR